MLVYNMNKEIKVEQESFSFKIIHLTISKKILKKFGGDIDRYKGSQYYYFEGIYHEIITNQNGIFDRLKRKAYDIGIAEFNETASAFAVFEALGIEETLNASSSVFFPAYLQFLGIDVLDYQVPEFKSAKPGDWNDGEWLKDNEENREEHEEANDGESRWLAQRVVISGNEITFGVLFEKIKYHFVNQHPLIKFNNFPEHEKIVYIGGFIFEDELLAKGKQMVDNEPDCVVLVAFGTVGAGHLDIEEMINSVFVQFQFCRFYVQTNMHSFSNIVTGEYLPQKEILSQTNTKLFISHCGINSVNESIYAGVPLICIPTSGDQIYNASTVEEKGIGIFLDYTEDDFIQSLSNALVQILRDEHGNLNFNSKYSLAAEYMRNGILRIYEHETMKDKILGKVDGTD